MNMETIFDMTIVLISMISKIVFLSLGFYQVKIYQNSMNTLNEIQQLSKENQENFVYYMDDMLQTAKINHIRIGIEISLIVAFLSSLYTATVCSPIFSTMRILINILFIVCFAHYIKTAGRLKEYIDATVMEMKQRIFDW